MVGQLHARRRVILAVLVALCVSILSSFGTAGAQTRSTLRSEQAISSTQDRVDVAAKRPWTLQELQTAQTYDLRAERLPGSAPISTDLTSHVSVESPQVTAGGLPQGAGGSGRLEPISTDGNLAAERNAAALLAPEGHPRADAAPEAIVDVSNPYPAAFTRFEAFTGIAGPDTYTVYPYSTQGKLFFTQKDPDDGIVKNFVCSASVMENSAIMTAGHCLHAGKYGAAGWSTNVVFVPAYYDGSAPLQQWTPSFLRVFTAWYNGADPARDIGGAPMNRNAAGEQLVNYTGWLGLAWNWGYQQHYNALGYPQAAPFNGQRLNICQSTVAYKETAYSPATMAIGCDMTGGSSGGGWIKGFGTTNWLNGVNSYKRIVNGTVLSQEMFSPYFDSAVKTVIWDCVTQGIDC